MATREEEAPRDAASSPSAAKEAARCLADALGAANRLHEPGERTEHRRLLERAIEQANQALAAAAHDDATALAARCTLAKAHAARSEDARHGAGQLSQSAQRAPTADECDEGWTRVAAIAAGAETSARVAVLMAAELEKDAPRSALARAARAAARRADAAACEARRIVDDRNDAYTFHTDSRFSFGEGWYVAAAGVLRGVAIQIEPGQSATLQAERFLHDAGLSSRLRQYRSRPRAVKHTPEIVARAFADDAVSAQLRLRTAFLGDAPIASPVIDWIDRRLTTARDAKRVLLWVRDGVHDVERNTTSSELADLAELARQAGLVPVLVGDAVRDAGSAIDAVDMTLFWKDSIFGGTDGRRAQLQFFEHLRRAHGVVGQVGVTTAGMDGPALMGLATAYLTDASNVRMRAWVGAVPGYAEIVRDGDYRARVRDTFATWAR